jgi:hypothetical protein
MWDQVISLPCFELRYLALRTVVLGLPFQTKMCYALAKQEGGFSMLLQEECIAALERKMAALGIQVLLMRGRRTSYGNH